MPDLQFEVVGVDVEPYATAPTLTFRLSVRNTTPDEAIQSVMLRTQVRIETTRRRYDAEAEVRLKELFGDPSQWGQTLRTMLWTQTTNIVPAFEESIVTDLPISCTYDFEVSSAKFLWALNEGEAPLLFLFSGTVLFRDGSDGPLQVSQISWEKESRFRLPIATWNTMMDRYFPNSAWIRVRRDLFDRLYDYRCGRMLPTWDEAIEELLRRAEQ